MRKDAIVILAAGASTRMGRDAKGAARDKLAEDVDGSPLLTCVAEAALQTGWDIYACVPNLDHPRVNILPTGVTIVPAPEAAEGMGASLRNSINFISHSIENVMILPADMPDLSAEDLKSVIAAHGAGQITRGATSTGQAGHPVIFPIRCLDALKGLQGDEGARRVVQEFDGPVHLVPLPDQHAITDLDTPQAWASWRAKRHL